MLFLVDVIYKSRNELFNETLDVDVASKNEVEETIKQIYEDWNRSAPYRKTDLRELVSIDSITPYTDRTNEILIDEEDEYIAAEEISLDAFVAILRKDVNRFSKYWEKGVKKQPEQFPEEMIEGDWFDQFISFMTG
jgi:hypothetical protein